MERVMIASTSVSSTCTKLTNLILCCIQPRLQHLRPLLDCNASFSLAIEKRLQLHNPSFERSATANPTRHIQEAHAFVEWHLPEAHCPLTSRSAVLNGRWFYSLQNRRRMLAAASSEGRQIAAPTAAA